jgi:hypothetical protein
MATYTTLEAAEPRRVLVHYHVMKCAGTTIATILEREFGDACYHVHRPDPRGAVSADDLAAFLRATPQARAVTSHHLRYPVPREGAVIVDCCPVRRPLDRLESLYNFMSLDASQLLHPLTSGGIAHFFTALAERYPDNLTNVQTAALGMRDRYRTPGRRDLETAVRRVEESGFVVLVDRFDESMVVAEYFLGPSWPGLKFHYDDARNTTRPVRYHMDERKQRFRERCGEDVYAMLEHHNELDEELCRAAGTELDRRISLVPSFASKLADFRARCAALGRNPHAEHDGASRPARAG